MVEYEGMLVSAAAAQRRRFLSSLIQRAAKMHRRLRGGTMSMLLVTPGVPARGAWAAAAACWARAAAPFLPQPEASIPSSPPLAHPPTCLAPLPLFTVQARRGARATRLRPTSISAPTRSRSCWRPWRPRRRRPRTAGARRGRRSFAPRWVWADGAGTSSSRHAAAAAPCRPAAAAMWGLGANVPGPASCTCPLQPAKSPAIPCPQPARWLKSSCPLPMDRWCCTPAATPPPAASASTLSCPCRASAPAPTTQQWRSWRHRCGAQGGGLRRLRHRRPRCELRAQLARRAAPPHTPSRAGAAGAGAGGGCGALLC